MDNETTFIITTVLHYFISVEIAQRHCLRALAKLRNAGQK
jgi:hypothetical protein